jgi:hypothetical protein
MSSLASEKQRAREQWSQDPCGAVYDREKTSHRMEHRNHGN